MNNRLQKKIKERLMGLNVQAGGLKEQIAKISDYNSIKEDLERKNLEVQLTDVLNRIKRINSVSNKHY